MKEFWQFSPAISDFNRLMSVEITICLLYSFWLIGVDEEGFKKVVVGEKVGISYMVRYYFKANGPKAASETRQTSGKHIWKVGIPHADGGLGLPCPVGYFGSPLTVRQQFQTRTPRLRHRDSPQKEK